MRLNSSPPEATAAVITKNTRASIDAGSCMPGWRARCAGGSRSAGATRRKTTPSAMHTSPGTTKAARRPKASTRWPVSSAAAAMPRLPARPLTPIVAPGFFACRTSIGMPTGW